MGHINDANETGGVSDQAFEIQVVLEQRVVDLTVRATQPATG